MSENYIERNFDNIKKYENVIENRLSDDFTIENALEDNAKILLSAKKHNKNVVLIDDEYKFDIDF